MPATGHQQLKARQAAGDTLTSLYLRWRAPLLRLLQWLEVIAHDGKTLFEGKLDANSTLTFNKPKQPFYVLFDTGPGLQSVVEQEEITVPPPGRQPGWMRQP